MRKTQVSLARRRLIETMQDVHFGAIEQLRVESGQPVLDPPPVMVWDIALGRTNGEHPARLLADFELKRQIVDLFELFDRELNITIERVVVQAGLPVRIRVRAASQT